MWENVDNDEEPTAPPVIETALHNAYPNPFNPTTTISYSLSEAGSVEIAVYNIRGQKVRQLLDAKQTVGDHKVTWDGADRYGKPVASGIYFYKMSTPHESFVKKMTMIK